MTKLGCEETVGEGVGALAPGTEVEVIRGPLTGVRGVLIRRDPRWRRSSP